MRTQKSITPATLNSQLQARAALLLLDVLPEDTFAQRHIPGAKNACVYEMVFVDKVRDLLSNSPNASLVLCGDSEPSGACQEAAERLAGAGLGDICILSGGLAAWREQGLPLEGHGRPEPSLPDGTYPVDTSASLVDWVGRNVANKHWGTLRLAEGSLTFKDGRPTGGRVLMDMNSLACADIAEPKLKALLIAHLKSADFFQTDQFPQALFEIRHSSRIPDVGAGVPNTQITGNLVLRGNTCDIQFDALLAISPVGDFVAQGAFEIDRTRWGIRYGSGKFFEQLGKHLVNDLIGIQLKIVVAKDALGKAFP